MENSADPNVTDLAEWTPLHVAFPTAEEYKLESIMGLSCGREQILRFVAEMAPGRYTLQLGVVVKRLKYCFNLGQAPISKIASDRLPYIGLHILDMSMPSRSHWQRAHMRRYETTIEERPYI